VYPEEISIPPSVKILETKISDSPSLSKTQIGQKLNVKMLGKFLTGKNLIIINDAHRSTPSKLILQLLFKLYPEFKLDAIAIATGTHKRPTDKELTQLLGGILNKKRVDLIIHDSEATNLVDLGQTSRGTRILINPIFEKYSKILLINSVEPHYFAGFTGGIKSIVPGLASTRTTEKNHSWALDGNSGPTMVWTNPLQLDLWEAGEIVIKNYNLEVFGIQLISQGKQIFDLTLGPIREAYEKAIKIANECFSINVEEKYDIIVSIVEFPLDRSLYQAQKGIENTIQGLKKGGTIILIAKCEEGMGSDAFYNTIKKYQNVEEILANINQENYKFGDHKVYKFAITAKYFDFRIISEMSRHMVESVFAKPMDIFDLEEFLRVSSEKGKLIGLVIDSGTVVLKSKV